MYSELCPIYKYFNIEHFLQGSLVLNNKQQLIKKYCKLYPYFLLVSVTECKV